MSVYHHVIQSLEVYPRVHFFSKRYHDIKEKYRKFTDKILKKRSTNHVEAPQNCLENGLTIKVVGKEDLDPTVFIATEPHLYKTLPSAGLYTETDFTYDTIVPVNPYKDCTRPSSYSIKKVNETKEFSTPASTAKEGDEKAFGSRTTSDVVICNAIVESLNDQGLEDIKLLWKISGKAEEDQYIGCFLLCQSIQDFTKSEESAFRRKLDIYFGDCWKLTNIITRGRNELKISEEISLCLEERIVRNLLTVESDLQTYTTGKKRSNTPKPLLEEENIKSAIKCFLQHVPNYYKELKSKSTRQTEIEKCLEGAEKQTTELRITNNESSEVQIQWTSLLIDLYMSLMPKLALVVKCSVVQAFSKRHNINVENCNHILIQNDFEQRCITMFSESLMYYVIKLWYLNEDPSGCTPLHESLMKPSLPQVLSLLQRDIFNFVTEIEKNVSRFATTLRKLLFEISSCLKKTKVDIEKIKGHAILDKAKIDIGLRKKILGIKEVYGVGTIYGQLEIHVNEIGVIERVESQIREMLRRNNVSCPFSVRVIEVKLEMLADHSFHEHGERLECQSHTGTLAGFVEGTDKKLYGLTCAHVVKDEEGCDVFIYDGSNSRLEFAKCVPHLIVSPGSSRKPLIDFAAVRVNNSVENRCAKFLKNDDSRLYPGVMATDTTDDLAGNYVYKHGATTQFTKGLVFSDDYSTVSNEERPYIFLVENYDDDGDDFAKPGDSGSMICTPDVDEEYIVKAVGVLNGCKIAPTGEDTPIFFSFRLLDGLRTLTERAQGVQFNFPTNCWNTG